MTLPFVKYHGNGNDFIVVDDRERLFDLNTAQIERLCHRHFGIGSDGIIFIRNHEDSDFEMVFHNPDGSKSLCGNGSRCAIDMAHSLGMIGESCSFMAVDGLHEGKIEGPLRCFKLHDVSEIKKFDDGYFLHNGSPHFVKFVEEVKDIDVFQEGRILRNDPRFQPGGTNVNFVSKHDHADIESRVFERGVENETLSSGTGTTAQALCSCIHFQMPGPITIRTKGGDLEVSFVHNGNDNFTDVWLKGPVTRVYNGTVKI